MGSLPDIFTELEISYFLLRRLLGVRTEGDKKAAKVCWVSDLFLLANDISVHVRFRNSVRMKCSW